MLAQWGCRGPWPWRNHSNAVCLPQAQQQRGLSNVYELQTHSPTHTESALPVQNCSRVNNLDEAVTQPPKDRGLTTRGQHPPLAKGEPHFYWKLILEDHPFPSLQNTKRVLVYCFVFWERGWFWTTWVVQYSFWKLKGPNSPSTGVHVGRQGALCRAVLGLRGKSICVKIQKTEARILKAGGEKRMEGGEQNSGP